MLDIKVFWSPDRQSVCLSAEDWEQVRRFIHQHAQAVEESDHFLPTPKQPIALWDRIVRWVWGIILRDEPNEEDDAEKGQGLLILILFVLLVLAVIYIGISIWVGQLVGWDELFSGIRVLLDAGK